MPTKKLHYFSGLFIALFVALHLFNHLCSLGGAAQHIAMMETLRPVYRNVFAEGLLLTAVAVQVVSGIQLFRATRAPRRKGFAALQRWSGLYLAMFLLIHLSAVMAGRYVLSLDTNFYFGVAGLNTFPLNLFFIPYYGLAVTAFFAHIAAVHQQKMRQSILGLSPGAQAKTILFIGILLTIVLMYGLTNGFRGVVIPEAYEVLIGK